MFKNYLKIAWRNLFKNKVFSLIHILGLTTGIAVCVMIFLYVLNEFSVDDFHKNGKNIYRVMRGYDSTKERVPYVSAPYAPALKNDFGYDIKQIIRILPSNALLSLGERSFNEKNLYYTDPEFFTVFSFPLLKGDPKTALKDPDAVVLTESTARKYFGTADAMNKVLEIDKERRLKVTGIAKDLPANSHLNFDLVASVKAFEHKPWFNVWINNGMFVYVELKEGVNKTQLQSHFPAFMQKYMGKDMQRLNARFDLALTPLKDIYFEHASGFDNVKHGDKKIVYIFMSIGMLIMLIACINFLNLSTIRAADRSKEVGLRKVMGALRNHLIIQFIGESMMLTVISCLLSIGLLLLLMPWYNQVLGYTLTVKWASMPISLFLLGLVIVVGILAGSYPAIFISAFSPVKALKGRLKFSTGATFFRQMLVVFQFSITVFLIIGTIIITKQMSFLKTRSLGFSKEQTIVIKLDNAAIANHRATFKNELEVNKEIESISFMSGEPGGFFDVHGFNAEGQPGIWKARTVFADVDYVKTLGLKMVSGRNLSAQFATDSATAVLINQTAAAKLGFTPQQAVGKWIKNLGRDSVQRRIVGVVADFNFLSLKENMDALVISPGEDRRVVLVKIKTGSVSAGLAAIKNIYSKVAPGYPLAYNFLDQQFDEAYKTDARQQTILSLFAGLAIFIACLGLFGLASFSAAKRTKEIGVRKVLGSSVQDILVLLSGEILKPVLIATIVAIPIGFYCMNIWLQNFAYRITMQWWYFVIAAVITFAVAITTISYNAFRAALANPVKSLRSE